MSTLGQLDSLCGNNQAPTANAAGPYTVPEGGGVQLDGVSSFDPDPGDTLSYEWDLDYDGVTLDIDATSSAPVFDAASLDGPDSRTVALRVTDGAGEASSVDTSLVTVTNVAPTADAGPDQDDVEWVDALMVTLDGSASSDPVDPLGYSCTDSVGTVVGTTATATVSISGLGTHTFTLTVDDGDDGTDSDFLTVTVVDTTAPVINGASADPSVLWPPNHKMRAVTVAVDLSDAGDANPTCKITSVASDEAADGRGDGNTTPRLGDHRGLDAESQVRAFRSGRWPRIHRRHPLHGRVRESRDDDRDRRGAPRSGQGQEVKQVARNQALIRRPLVRVARPASGDSVAACPISRRSRATPYQSNRSCPPRLASASFCTQSRVEGQSLPSSTP